MQFTVFINTREGRTMIDKYSVEDNKTALDIFRIYRGEYAKVDAYTDEGKFVRSVFINPEGYQTWGTFAVQSPVIVPTEKVGV